MLHHVAIEVTREQAPGCRDFYRLLGFRPVEPPPTLRERALWLEREGTQVHLLFTQEPTPAPEGHLAVVVEDYDRVLESLCAGGHPPQPRAEHWGSPRALVRDPAGHRVELMAFPPGRRAGGLRARRPASRVDQGPPRGRSDPERPP
ncbi:MAG: VOC family protein [Solirubrobacteraceae bacterium]